MRASRGFSLIELLIVIAISTLIMLVLIQMLFAFSKTYETQQVNIEVGLGTTGITSALQTLVSQGDAVIASHVFSGTTYTTSSSTLIVELPSIDSSGMTVSGVKDYVVFYTVGTSAYRTISADNASARGSDTKTLTQKLQEMRFTYNNATPSAATTVTANATTSATVRQQTVTSHLSTQIHLRNASQ